MTAYAPRAFGSTVAYDDSLYRLIDIDIVGNGFVPGLPGIHGNEYLQALQTAAGSTTLAIYSPDGKFLIGYLPLNDFYFLLLTPEGVLWLADQSVNIDQVGGATVVAAIPVTLYINGSTGGSNTNPLAAQDIEQAGYVSASSPPTNTNSGTDTSYTFASQVSRVIMQNNTSVNVYFAFDTAASAGSLLLTPGSTVVYPKKCTVLHLYTATAQVINGTSSGNIVVLGAL
jgi:hypothetical protein